MKNYIYSNDKQFVFFKAENNEEARNKIVNSLDLSYNPYCFEVLEYNTDNFTVKAEMGTLSLRRHFKINWSGNGLFNFGFQTIN